MMRTCAEPTVLLIPWQPVKGRLAAASAHATVRLVSRRFGMETEAIGGASNNAMADSTRQKRHGRGLWWIALVALSIWNRGLVSAQSAEMRVEPIVSMRDAGKGGMGHAARRKSFEVLVEKAGWVDTGEDVQAGEVLQVTAGGSFTLADGRVVTPAGLARGWKDLLRQFPLNGAETGALIGRVSALDASVPFLIGDRGSVTMPTSGRLFLRLNASADLEGTGRFEVKLRQDSSAKAGVAGSPREMKMDLRPEMFAALPRRVTDREGNPGDMVNFALVGSLEQVNAAFAAAGWVPVDASVQDAVLHGILSTLGHEAYTAMPMSTLYLFGRKQDLSFARGDPLKVAAERHHLRVWKTGDSIDGVPVWVGSATHDVGFERDQRNGEVTHKIDPKVDDERDFLLKSFDATGMFTSAAYVTPPHAVRKAMTATGGAFESDGRIAVMALK